MYIQGAESLYSVFCLHFFINGIISTWQAGYFFLSWFNHRLLVSPYLALKLQYHLFVFFWVTRLTFSLQKWKCKWVLLLSSGIATEQLLSSLPSGFFRSVLYMKLTNKSLPSAEKRGNIPASSPVLWFLESCSEHSGPALVYPGQMPFDQVHLSYLLLRCQTKEEGWKMKVSLHSLNISQKTSCTEQHHFQSEFH